MFWIVDRVAQSSSTSKRVSAYVQEPILGLLRQWPSSALLLQMCISRNLLLTVGSLFCQGVGDVFPFSYHSDGVGIRRSAHVR